MKVKIGDTVYDANEQPVMLILTQFDKQNIANMDPECFRYAAFPDDCSSDDIREWMKEE